METYAVQFWTSFLKKNIYKKKTIKTGYMNPSFTRTLMYKIHCESQINITF